MKQSPHLQQIEDNMRQGLLAVYDFLGPDSKSLADILRDDAQTLEQLGIRSEAIGERLDYFTTIGRKNLGTIVTVDDKFEVYTEEHKGTIPCPFADNYNALKCNTRLTNLASGKTIEWSDLNTHMIAAHGFYEGKGARFRLEPADLVQVLGLVVEG